MCTWSPESQPLSSTASKDRQIYFALRVFWIVHKEENFYSKDGEPLDQVSQRSCEYPIIGSLQSHVGQGFEQLNLTDGVPT